MSSSDQVLNNGQQAITNYDTSKIFLWNNRYDTFEYENSTGAEVTLEAGTVMGRISTSGKVVPLDSGASDGSQFPIGVLNSKWTVADGETVNVSLCVSGDVASDKLVFTDEYDDLDTVVSDRRLRDRIGSDTVGIKLVSGTELTGYDNE